MTFEEALLPHLDAAYNLARWLTRNEADAQDVVQEAYLRALKFFSGFHGTDGRAWLLAIVRNAFYTSLRRNDATEVAYDFDETIQHRESDEPDPERLLEFREVIILRDLEELSYKEIAVVTGIPIGTVMSRLARARNKLQSCLRGPCRESKVRGIKEAAQRY
jgi:RNA polymerase sigma-70 factor (ECF subfamily)